MMSTRQSALTVHAVHLGVKVASRWEAVAYLGAELERSGAAHAGYADSLAARERRFSTYLGHGIAVPHALHMHDYLLAEEGIVFARFATPIPWDDEEVSMCLAVAATADAQVEILCRLTATFLNSEHLDTLATSADPAAIERILQST
ncbi:PTS sugar transporter subunit IIA [Amycolatopsis sp. NBC_00438]